MNYAIILSGGTGVRLGSDIPKQYIEVGGKPIIMYCVETMEKTQCVDGFCVVAATEWQDEIHGWIEKKTISNNIGKQIIIDMMKDGTKASKIVEDRGLSQISDEGAIKEIVQKVVDANPQQVEAYRGGKVQLLGFFVGQVMKETKGRANPKTVNELIRKILEG